MNDFFALHTLLNAVERIETKLDHIEERMSIMQEAIANLTAKVTEIQDVAQGTLTFLADLKQQIIDLQGQILDPTQVQNLTGQLDAVADSLAVATGQTPSP